MTKFLLQLFMIAASVCMLGTNTAYAFAADDVADVEISPDLLGKGWKWVPNVLGDSDTTSRYERKTEIVPVAPAPPPTGTVPSLSLKKAPAQQQPTGPRIVRIESLTRTQVQKPPNIETDVLLKQMGAMFTSGVRGKGCESGLMTQEKETGDQFRAWIQIFQCQKSKQTGLQYTIDADPQTLYLLTYSDTHYPFTVETRDAAEAMIKGAVTICYHGGKDCYTLK
jgi:hypothetical protein